MKKPDSHGDDIFNDDDFADLFDSNDGNDDLETSLDDGMGEDSPGVQDDNLDDLDIFSSDIFDDDEGSTPVKKSKKKSPVGKVIAGVAVLSLLVGGGVVAYNNKDAVISAIQGNQQNEQVEPEPLKDVEIQLVNTEQVLWAEEMCNAVSGWSSSPLKEVPDPDGDRDVYNSVQAQKIVPGILRDNADVLRDRADGVSSIVPDSYDRAREFERGTILTDHNKKVGQSPDPDTTTASAGISDALNSYADSLDAMADDLDDRATYNFSGQRESLDMMASALPGMEDQLATRIGSELSSDVFDNPVTMERIAQLDACAGSMISMDDLQREYADVLEEQKTARNFINVQLCEPFLQRNETVDQDRTSVEACEKVMKENVSPESSPAQRWNIIIDDQQRAIPDNISIDSLTAQPSPSPSDSLDNTQESR